MVQNLAKITLKQIENSIAEDAFLFVSEVFAMRSTLHRAINIEIDLDPRLKLINSKLEKHLKLIDPEKRNILMYCFECEVK